jgi:hypothetical protein
VLKTADSNPKSTLDMISTSHPHIISEQASHSPIQQFKEKTQTVFNKQERRPQEHY